MYKTYIFFGLFLLNIALYVPTTAEVQADLSGDIIKKADTTFMSQVSEEVAIQTMNGIFIKARDAKVAEFALERGMSLEEYQGIMQGSFPACLMETPGGALGMTSMFSQLDDMVNQDINRANFGLDQTLSAEAFSQYAEEISGMLELNKDQYQTMLKEQIKGISEEILNYYKKFPSPPVTACT